MGNANDSQGLETAWQWLDLLAKMNILLESALNWVSQDIAVIPISYRSKRPDRRHLPNGEWEEFQTRLPTEAELRRWFKSPLQNIAVVTRHSNLIIADCDNLGVHQLWLSWLPRELQRTFKVKTWRGYHYYYKVETLPDHTMKWAAGVDVKCTGYCLAPPSIHPSGQPYQVIDDSPVCGVQSINDLFPTAVIDAMSSNLQICNTPMSPTLDDPWQPAPHIQGYDLNHLKQAVPILSFFSQSRDRGNGFHMIRCPFHDDRHESAWVDTRRNRFGCNKCITGSWSVVDVVMALNVCDFEAAVSYLISQL